MPIPSRFSSEYAVLLLESCVYSASVCGGTGAPQRSTCTSEAPSGTGASVVFFPRYFLYLKPCILLISFVLPFYNKLFISVSPFLKTLSCLVSLSRTLFQVCNCFLYLLPFTTSLFLQGNPAPLPTTTLPTPS